MANLQLITRDDYVREIARVEQLYNSTEGKQKRMTYKYLTRLWHELDTYDMYKFGRKITRRKI